MAHAPRAHAASCAPYSSPPAPANTPAALARQLLLPASLPPPLPARSRPWSSPSHRDSRYRGADHAWVRPGGNGSPAVHTCGRFPTRLRKPPPGPDARSRSAASAVGRKFQPLAACSLLLCSFLALLPTGQRKQIFSDHRPAHIALESALSFVEGAPHRNRILQMTDGGFFPRPPAQRPLEPTFLLVLATRLRQAPTRLQGYLLHSQILGLAFVLRREKSAVRRGQSGSLPEHILMLFQGGQERIRVRRIPLQNFVTAHDPVLHFVARLISSKRCFTARP